MRKRGEIVATTVGDVSGENDFGVPKKQWRRWTVEGKRLFNQVYEAMINNQYNFSHPDADTAPEHFNTTAWNAAWWAADFISRKDEW